MPSRDLVALPLPLQGMNDELQTQLLNQEKEVERLKHALEAAAERSLSQPHSPARCARCGQAAGRAGGLGIRSSGAALLALRLQGPVGRLFATLQHHNG